MENSENIFVDDVVENEETSYSLSNFNLVTTPNDFNAATIVAFMDKGVFKIPSFQRNFVWDIQKASKLIESLIIGLPIPQIFLYEKGRNNFEIIDGQQRLLSLYFFVKGRFPRNEYRYELRNPENMGEKVLFKEEFLNDDKYFTKFNLKLLGKSTPEGQENLLDSKNYNTLEEYKVELDLSTIRNMVIKSAENNDDEHLARYEIFNRLNSGGINLNGQEIRMSLYSCEFLNLLTRLNKNETWRGFFGKSKPDNRLKDIELILRLFAMLINGGKEVHTEFLDTSKILYQNSILSFLNNFANYSKKFDDKQLDNFSKIWESFMNAICGLDISVFSNTKDESAKAVKKISIPVFEAVFYGIYRNELKKETVKDVHLTEKIIDELKNDNDFLDACNGKTSSKNQVNTRLQKSLEYFSSKGI